MWWEYVLFSIAYILFFITGKKTMDILARFIIKRWGDSILRYVDRHSSSPILKLLFKRPNQSINKVNQQYNQSNQNKPVYPLIVREPIASKNKDDKKGNKNSG
jgi:hypothetical protein